jgi:hypothetical protein
MKIIIKVMVALAAAALIATVVASGLTPIAPASPSFAKKCSKEKCRERCTGRCDRGMCEMCDRR